MSEPSLLSTLANRCPRCGKGAVMSGLLTMNERCPECGLQFEQETGQYFGATVLSYGIGAAFALPVFFVLLVKRYPVWIVLGVPILLLAILAPFTVRYSRLGWAYAMYYLNPRQERPERRR